MNLKSIWSVLEECFEPLNDGAYSVWREIAQEQGFAPGWMTWVAAIFVFYEEPFSLEEFMHLFPYGSAQVNMTRFDSAVKQGFMAASSGNKYRAAEQGKYWVSQLILAAEKPLATLQPLPSREFQKILEYIRRLISASLSAQDPPSTFGVSHYYKNMHPGDDASSLRLFIHYFGTLDKYRGNAHRATWDHFRIEGNQWEIFSEIWGGRNNTPDKLLEDLSFRGITRDEYAHILQELVERGWIEENAGVFRVTDEGKRIREEAETLTDQYFFAPWSCLNESELMDLSNLSRQLRDGLSG